MDRTVINKLDEYYARYPGFKVQRFIEYPCPWVEYRGEGYERYLKQFGDVNHRQLMIDEVLIDIDSKTLQEGIEFADKIETKLNEKEMTYERWNSGGNGVHFHLFFPQLMEYKTDKHKRNRIKKKIIYWLLGELKGDKLLDMYTKQLVQIEYANHRKGGIKTLIHKESGTWPVNLYPKVLDDEYEEEKQAALEVKYSVPETTEDLNCIKFLSGKQVNKEKFIAKEDGMYRAMFALASWYVKKGLSPEQIEKKLFAWYDKIPLKWRRASAKTVNKRIISYTIKKTNGSMGCPYKRDLMEDLNCANVCKGCQYNIWE